MNTTKERETKVFLEVCNNCTVKGKIEFWVNLIFIHRLEVCMILSALFMFARSIGAPRRRQTQSSIIRYGVQGVSILSYPLVSYALGLMGQKCETFGSIELYLVWAMFLAMLFGGANALSIQKLDESKQLMKLYCDNIVFAVYIIFVLSMLSNLGGRLPSLSIIVTVFTLLLPIKYLEQWRAAVLTRKPLVLNGIRWLAKYMYREHQHSTSHDPRTMIGYKYSVLIYKGCPTIGGDPITVEDIWCRNIGVLSSDNPHIHRLKDLCLSFSMFHLVVRRYFGYTCPESNLDKTRDLVLHGLLRAEQEYGRAFEVIEAELAFLYDFFFTKYAFIMYGNEVWCCALPLAFTFLSIAVGKVSLSGLNPHNSLWEAVETKSFDVVVTIIVLVVLSISQLLEIWFYCDSDWAKVSLVCKYVTNPSWQGNARIGKLLSRLGRPRKCLRYWRNTIGQYSVLDSFDSGCWDRIKNCAQSRKSDKPVELTLEVKKAVAWNIKNSINARLSSISSALIRHGVSHELHWACQIDSEITPTLTHIILVWHIATSYCEISEKIRYQQENIVHLNRRVATSLSKYVAYLIAFAPTLLPGRAIESECTLDDLEREAKEVFKKLTSPSEKYGKLIELQHLDDPRLTGSTQLLKWGALLGNQLENMGNPAMPWDLLADFWTEMMVYIAPSDNVADHIELLAEGGEFVTHVWALLMHAGILEWPAVPATTAVP